MCGRFTLTASSYQQLALRFGVSDIPDIVYQPRYNIAPSQPVLSVIVTDGQRRMGFLQWGLIPSWAKDASIGNKMINARSETVHEKPSFRSAFQKRRCLIIADGFYEWSRNNTPKQPHHIGLASKEPFAFAGLWESWRPMAGGNPLFTCTILTTEANTLIAPIHPRMPLILPKDQEAAWLEAEDTDTLQTLLRPFPGDLMSLHPVSTLVNSPKNESPECITPL